MPPASDTTEAALPSAYLTSIWHRRSIEFKEGDATSVVSDAVGISRTVQVAQTLHGNTVRGGPLTCVNAVMHDFIATVIGERAGELGGVEG